MRIATFLFLKTGRNIFKPTAPAMASPTQPAVAAVDAVEAVASEDDAIHIGPRGGRYRLDDHGRKVYLKAA